MITYLKKNEFQELFDNFATSANSSYHHFKRLPYDTWRDIKNKFVGKCIEVEYLDWDNKVVISTNDGYDMVFSAVDNSFGEYLFEQCLSDPWCDYQGWRPDDWYKNSEGKKCKQIIHRADGSIVEEYVREGDLMVRNDDGVSWCKTSSGSTWQDMSSLKTDVDKKIKTDKENSEMKGFNFDFGPCTGDNVKMSMYGLAVQNNAGVWVSYNAKTGEVIDVDILNFDARKYMFKMPVAIKDIKKGDIVVHNRIPMFVTDVTGGDIKVVDIREGEKKEIVPTTNMFGFNYVTKIVSMFDAVGQAPTPDAPFGNMLPLMLMGENGKDFDPAMLMLMMNSNGATSTGFDMSNPMMLYFLMKDGKSSDMLPLMFMMNAQKPAAAQHTCNCGGHTGDAQ